MIIFLSGESYAFDILISIFAYDSFEMDHLGLYLNKLSVIILFKLSQYRCGNGIVLRRGDRVVDLIRFESFLPKLIVCIVQMKVNCSWRSQNDAGDRFFIIFGN